jgi:hypothetical protein
MKRIAIVAAVIGAAVAGVLGLASLTQNRPDVAVPGSETTLDFRVSTKDYQRGPSAAATALWAVCSASVDGEVSAMPVAVGDAWRVTVTPAIGEHGQKRLLGCLEDLTLDRVLGEVVSVRRTG